MKLEDGFYTSDPQERLEKGFVAREVVKQQRCRQGGHLNTCRGGETDRHVLQCVIREWEGCEPPCVFGASIYI